MATKINVGGLEGYADFIIAMYGQVMAMGLYDRSANKTRALSVKATKSVICYRKGYREKRVNPKGDYKVSVCDVKNGRDRFYYALIVSEEIGKSCLLTTQSTFEEDLYNLLMKNYTLPLLKEWVPYIAQKLIGSRILNKHKEWDLILVGDGTRSLPISGTSIPLSQIEGYSLFLSEQQLEQIVSDGLKEGELRIGNTPSEPLAFRDFNDYITKYGHSLVSNLEKVITPLSPLKPSVDGLALYNMRLFPQQAASVNGIISLMKSGSRYGLLNEGMGVGKTIQALSVVEGYFNEEYMRKHNCSLKEALESGEVSYRVAIVCPGHLVNKWCETIANEIPQAKPLAISSFSQFVEMRAGGKERKGKEIFVMSKDFIKLGGTYEPIPTKMAKKYAYNKVCRPCKENGLHNVQKGYGVQKCPDCGSNDWVKEKVYGQKFYGMICPSCGELLIRSQMKSDGGKEYSELQELVLTAADFAGRTVANSECYHCGAPLWGVSSKVITQGSLKDEFAGWQKRKKKWQKIRHYKNFSRKDTVSSWCLKRFDKDMTGIESYLEKNTIPDNWYELKEMEGGARKCAPSQYIKKYLKGYFDVLILDECHKFEGAGSAQAVAAHALMRCSKFTLGLTGTLLNGMASSIFYLLFMLDPKRMIEKGFSYGDSMEFSRRYGCVETSKEVDENDARRGSSSRSRGRTNTRVKPGISPLVYTDFLLDKAVFLDLSDLSKYLPKLYEKVEVIPQESDVASSYTMAINTLKSALKEKAGAKMMSYVLNFGLSYPDKPYGRKPIMSITMDDTVVCVPDNCDQYAKADMSTLLNKEERLIDIVNEERDEGRNLFIFCSYTGDEEQNVTYRLKEIIEAKCNLRGRVQIIQASSPEAVKRESWMHEKAADGMQVFICNPKVVETGLDFCFAHMGKQYNYPTLIFYQMSYELAVLWQASRRAYRLNQKEECRNYYLCYENTLQQVAVQLMAEKQVATSAIQGKFSAEGLASMANGVDPRIKMAQALAEGDCGDRESLENMFDVLNASNNADNDAYADYRAPTYEEVVGHEKETLIGLPVITKVEPKKEKSETTSSSASEQLSIFDLMFGNEDETDCVSEMKPKNVSPKKEAKVKKKKKVKEDIQFSIFDELFT